LAFFFYFTRSYASSVQLFRAQRGGDELTARNIHALEMEADTAITSLAPLFATSHLPSEPCNKLMKNMTTTENTGNKDELLYTIMQ
jgi:hypothetical protein